MSYGWHDAIGIAGVMLVLICYLLLQMGRMSAESLLYSAVNGLGALLILISLAYDFNLSAFLMEAAWLLVSLYGVARYYTRDGRAAGT
jgi:paired small multidrug resistance pump